MQIRTVLYEQLHKPRVVRQDIQWPRLYLGEYPRMEIFNGVRHERMFSYLRTTLKLIFCAHHSASHEAVQRCVQPPLQAVGRNALSAPYRLSPKYNVCP